MSGPSRPISESESLRQANLQRSFESALKCKNQRQQKALWHRYDQDKKRYEEQRTAEYRRKRGYETSSQSYKVSRPQKKAAVTEALRSYGGIGRLSFMGILVGLLLAQTLNSFAMIDSSGVGLLVVNSIFLVAHIFLVYYRLKNIGANPWWCLLVLIPIISLFFWIYCLAFQEGYQITKKLDAAGQMIIYILLALAVVCAAGVMAR